MDDFHLGLCVHFTVKLALKKSTLLYTYYVRVHVQCTMYLYIDIHIGKRGQENVYKMHLKLLFHPDLFWFYQTFLCKWYIFIFSSSPTLSINLLAVAYNSRTWHYCTVVSVYCTYRNVQQIYKKNTRKHNK